MFNIFISDMKWIFFSYLDHLTRIRHSKRLYMPLNNGDYLPRLTIKFIGQFLKRRLVQNQMNYIEPNFIVDCIDL